eukprot:TRINITY_DN14878_c0_g1_i1.p1 TRINITY_DN14878_c0_g1~~TRINITY_DN14878_c0_g1_i1.p1  ORF type:complete len:236 (-),score=49.23 TRINITY_DN14878_c0_g1_i1:58-765(-)
MHSRDIMAVSAPVTKPCRMQLLPASCPVLFRGLILLLLAVASDAFSKQSCLTACSGLSTECSGYEKFLTAETSNIGNAIHNLCADTSCLAATEKISSDCEGYEAYVSSMTEAEKETLRATSAIPLQAVCSSDCSKAIISVPAPSECLSSGETACPLGDGGCPYFRTSIDVEAEEKLKILYRSRLIETSSIPSDKELTPLMQYNSRIPCARARNIKLGDDKIKSCQEHVVLAVQYL